jgi:hypothetical protein
MPTPPANRYCKICGLCTANKLNDIGACWLCVEFRSEYGVYPVRNCDTFKRNASPPAPDEPTDATPGSPLKVAVMMKRYETGRAIHHPLDEKIDPVPQRPVEYTPRVIRKADGSAWE